MLDWDSPNEERGNFRYADTYRSTRGSTTVNVSSYSLYMCPHISPNKERGDFWYADTYSSGSLAAV